MDEKKSFNNSPDDPVHRQQLNAYLVFAYASLGCILIFIYGIFNLYYGKTIVGIVELIVSVCLLVLNTYKILIQKKVSLPANLIILVTYALSAYLFLTGGLFNTGIFWIFVFPPFYFFSKGSRKGLICFLILLFGLAGLYALSSLGIIATPHSKTTCMFGGIVLIFQAVFAFWYEEMKQRYLSHIGELRQLLPICSFCKQIRDDSGYWRQIESYFHQNSGIDFSHGLCPGCAEKHYPEYYKKR